MKYIYFNSSLRKYCNIKTLQHATARDYALHTVSQAKNGLCTMLLEYMHACNLQFVVYSWVDSYVLVTFNIILVIELVYFNNLRKIYRSGSN